jgi:hypothetical protein
VKCTLSSRPVPPERQTTFTQRCPTQVGRRRRIINHDAAIIILAFTGVPRPPSSIMPFIFILEKAAQATRHHHWCRCASRLSLRRPCNLPASKPVCRTKALFRVLVTRPLLGNINFAAVALSEVQPYPYIFSICCVRLNNEVESARLSSPSLKVSDGYLAPETFRRLGYWWHRVGDAALRVGEELEDDKRAS